MRVPPTVLLAAALAAPVAAQGFVERARELGLEHEFLPGLDRIGALHEMHDWVQIGMAPGDLDGDGDLDLVALGRLAPNHLFLNQGGVFADATAGSGIASPELDNACALADWDRDGDLDVFVGVYDHGIGPQPGDGRLLRNEGGAVFEDVTVLAGRIGNGHTLAGIWHDLDLDGFEDLYLSEFGGTPNALYRNRGDGGFVEEAFAVGAAVWGSTHVSGACDLNGDGWFDLSIGNDAPVSVASFIADFSPDRVLYGRADDTYADKSIGSGMDQYATTMGIAWGDVNYDGRPDSYRTQVGPQFLLVNMGWPTTPFPFVDQAFTYGVDVPIIDHPDNPGVFGETVGWGCVFADVDFDPWLDLFVVAGYVCPGGIREQHNFLFAGDGPSASFRFTDKTKELGLFDTIDDRALAALDLERDGDVDFLVGAASGKLRCFENRIDPQGQGWIAVQPVCGTSGAGGGGVQAVWDDSLGYPHRRWIGGDGQTASQNEARVIFGLGHEPFADVRVEFPSGIALDFPATAPNTEIQAVEPELVRLSKAVVRPNEALEVTAFAHDASGQALDGTAGVSIEAPGLHPAGPVVHAGGNEFRRRFAGAAAPGTHAVEVTFDAFRVRVEPNVRVLGPPDAGGTTLRVRPEGVRAGSADSFTVEVAPRDAAGTLLGPGRAVTLAVRGASPPVAAADLGDGRYAATFAAPAAPGVYPIDAAADGVALPGLDAIEAAGAAAVARSTFYLEVPDPGIALDLDLMQLLVTPRDAAGRRLGPDAEVRLRVKPDPGTAAVAVRADLLPAAQDDGDHAFVLQKAEQQAAAGTITAFVDGVFVRKHRYRF